MKKVILGIMLVFLSIAFLLQAVNIQPIRAETVNVVDYAMCEGISQSGFPINRTNIFYITDPYAYCWFEINGPLYENHTVELRWYDPEGNLIRDTNGTLGLLPVDYISLNWDMLSISENASSFATRLERPFNTSVLIDGVLVFNETWQVVGRPLPVIVLPPPSTQVNVYLFNSQESAPMGIADYGIGPDGPYEYTTNSFVGIITINSLLVNLSSCYDAGFQLNVELEFNANHGQYVYWIQNVAVVTTSGNTLYLDGFLDNIWNFSELNDANISSSGLSGNGQFGLAQNPPYYCVASDVGAFQPTMLTTPTTIMLSVTSGVSSSGEPTVSFTYDIGSGLVTYDTVTFTNVTGLSSSPVFEVNGFSYTPAGYFYDAALILAGPGGGAMTTDIQSDVQLQLEYWNGHNYQIVPNAYNFGSNTGESINNVLCGFSTGTGNGAMSAEIQAGAGQLRELYDQSQMGVINLTSHLTSGTLYVTNASDPNAAAWQIPFVNGTVNAALYPGTYLLQVYDQNGVFFYKGNITVGADQTLARSIPIPGDLNGDGRVDLRDLVLFVQAYGSRPGESNWNPNADMKGDGVVDLADLVVLTQHYGWIENSTYLGPGP